ncbi:5959_t:CDS:2 [Cetraspora pellucida]|uniref:5959_t:CDS:1 n=1 Tax=Cetraspora pellucida TaxID=1433469 RepID=A0ACA9LN48_9GLOM|nr:5959_t:CDS:2 [Cetraspora pellucida]
MPFCPSAFHAKNVEITVTCINCDKPRLLFSSRKLSDKDCKMLYQFLKMILYSCKTTFKNTSELTSATPSESLDEHGEGDDKNNDEGDDGDDSDDEYNDKGDNNFNNEYEHNVNLDENEDDQTDQDDVNHSNTESRDLTNNSTKNIKDSVQELFTRVFVNDSLICASPIKKPYYSAKIYPIICYLCGSPSVSNEKAASRNMRPNG